MTPPLVRRRRVTALLFVGVLVALPALVGTSPTAQAAPTAGVNADGSYSETKTLRRAHLNEGVEQVVDTREVTVTADHTTSLRGRERIKVAWSGARPSGGRSSNPYGEGGLTQEYPVVILQCRGVENASGEEEQLRPETCWTTTWPQRSAVGVHRTAVWRHDRFAGAADRDVRSGMAPFPADACGVPSESVFSARLTPFVAANGTRYHGCNGHMPPEAAFDAAFPAAEVAAFTGANGSGSANFEVRTAVENESLGCSNTVSCSLVVIPIMGVSCGDTDVECRRTGNFTAGSNNFSGIEPHAAVSPKYWWAPSNWQHRFSIPLSFALPPDTCDVLDSRAPVGFYGSELLSQASLQWAPAYCLNASRFKFQHNRMPDEAGFNLMAGGGAVAAVVSSEHEAPGDTPIAYAPTAVTGFSIGYIIDRPDNAGEYDDLKLNARLIAKLLTQSYPASALGQGHPGMGNNPLTINQDPEFKELNPGLDERAREAGATLLSLSDSSDVIEALTSYIRNDAAAREFISGKPDPWGMKVNPTYQGIALPTREWPLLDQFKPSAEEGTCRHANNDTPYLTQLAAPVTELRKIAYALIDGWPNVQTRCEGPFAGGVYNTGRVLRQSYGQRFMLGLVSIGDATRFGLRSASLATTPGRFVAPSEATLAAGIKVATRKGACGAHTLAMDDLVAARTAYPGTLVVQTATRLTGLSAAEAKTVSNFIRISTTEGQRKGRGNGQLPAGFLPIVKTGPTAPLHAAAERTATWVAAQKGRCGQAPAGTPGSKPGQGGSGGAPTGATPIGAPAVGAPVPAGPAVLPAAEAADVVTVATRVQTSDIGRLLLPGLLALCLLGGIGLAGLRVATALRRQGPA